MRTSAGMAAVAMLTGAGLLAGCSSLGGRPAGAPPAGAARQAALSGPFRPRTVPVPKALSQLGITAGQGLRVSGDEKLPLFPAAALGGGLVLGMRAAKAPAGSPPNRLAGYAVARLSDGRVTRLPPVHPGWNPGPAPQPMATTANGVIWLEADRRPDGYLWVLYSAGRPGSRPELLDGNREPVPVAGVPSFIGVEGNAACWPRSDDGRYWTIVRRSVTGPGPTVTARVHDVVTACLPAGNDTVVVTHAGPAAAPARAGEPPPGNLLDVTPEGQVSILLSGSYAVAVLGQQVAYYSSGGTPANRTVSVARLAGHKLTQIATLGIRGAGLLGWLDSTHLVVGAGPADGRQSLRLVDVRTGRSRAILPGRSLQSWAGVSAGHLIYARSRSAPGPDQGLEIDEFAAPSDYPAG